MKASGEIVLRVPVGLAGEMLFDRFQGKGKWLLGDYTSLGEWEKFFEATYSLVYRDGEGWVLVATEPQSHIAEIHAYAFDRRFGDKRTFFEDVIRDLEARGKRRLWTTLHPSAGKRVREELVALGFEREGILRSLYYLGEGKGFADGELWARISLGPVGG